MASKPLELTAHNFEALVLRRSGPVLVDFWASDCTSRRVMEAVLETLAEELDGRLLIGKVNVDEQPALAAAARIRAVPTLVLLNDGEVEDVFLGVPAADELRQRLDALTGAHDDTGLC